MSDIHIKIDGNILSYYGAILATFGFALSIFNYLRDRAKLKIEYKVGWKFIGAVAPLYKNNVLYNEVKVINCGRRPIKIEKVAFRISGKNNWSILSDSFANFKNKILTEDNPSESFYVEKGLIKEEVYFIAVFDAKGQCYKKWLNFKKYILLRFTSMLSNIFQKINKLRIRGKDRNK